MMSPDDVGSNPRHAALLTALARARASDPEQHEHLRKDLCCSDFLNQLDSPKDYEEAAGRLYVERVIHALRENRAAAAQSTLVALTQDKVFCNDVTRVEALITATACVRPPPPELVPFWAAHCQPTDSFKHLTVETLVANGSEPALQLFEQRMVDPKFEEGDKLFWLRRNVVPHRNDGPLLQCCERLLKGRLPDALRSPLVEVLFDYRPRQWYRLTPIPEPPPREKASPEALKQLRTIGQHALKNVELTDDQKKVVESVLEQLTAKKP